MRYKKSNRLEQSLSGAKFSVSKKKKNLIFKKIVMFNNLNGKQRILLNLSKQNRLASSPKLPKPFFSVKAEKIIKKNCVILEMPFVHGLSGSEIIINSQKQNLESLIKSFKDLILSFKSIKIHGHKNFKMKAREKISQLEDLDFNKKYTNYFKYLRYQLERTDFNIYETMCHGDLTFSNIIITSSSNFSIDYKNNKFFLIDWLDTYFNSYLQDLAKLKQELFYGWSSRYISSSQKLNNLITGEYIWKKLFDHFISDKNKLLFKIIMVLCILRIFPYAKTDIDISWIDKVLENGVRGMNILITGVAGFVGSTLCEELLRFKSLKIIGVDNLSYGKMENINKFKNRIQFLKKDVCNLKIKDLNQYGKISIIIHLAAIAPLPDNQMNPYESIKNNVASTANLLEISRHLEIQKFIFMSSGAVYERTNDVKTKLSEEEIINPILMYPTSKDFGEKLCDIFYETYNLPTIKIRLFNLYGPRQNYTRKHPPLLSQLIKSILTDQKVTIYNLNQKIKRDYIYIDDLIALISKIINDKKHTLPSLINACSGESLSVPEIIKKIELIAKKQFIIDSPKHASNFWGKYKQLFQGKYKIKDIIIENEIYKKAEGDPSVFKSIIKKEPINFETGIKKCIEYAKKII